MKTPGYRLPLVLLVHEQKTSRDMYAQYLRFAGHDVEVSGDAVEAARRVDEVRPDVIVIDLSRSRISALEATHGIKTAAHTRDIPVIALAGSVTSRVWALEAGCETALDHPCYPDVLTSEIRRVLDRRAQVA